jgi:hypothetical protein
MKIERELELGYYMLDDWTLNAFFEYLKIGVIVTLVNILVYYIFMLLL